MTDNIDSLASFLSDYKQLHIDAFNQYENKVKTLGKAYNKILQCKKDSNHTEAWDFSVFSIIKILRPEENLHSPMLYELLNTIGAHGQKDLFYKLFLEEVLGAENSLKFINESHEDYHIRCEEAINNENEKGRIDLTVKSLNPDKPFAIIIENKWESGDSCPDQLFKYYINFTEGKGYTDENLLVIYLTKYGGNPTWIENDKFNEFLKNNRNINYFPISYSKHIKNWLEKSVTECKSEKVKYTITQYIRIL
ncbi:MAG: PD-(D/E)XK nuclease family protein [Carboxylicivirga sp.]|jgi:hypothetical protein|nr:PD-(D/E)XK nuclease family protein [Carboxylicivirga sp.]